MGNCHRTKSLKNENEAEIKRLGKLLSDSSKNGAFTFFFGTFEALQFDLIEISKITNDKVQSKFIEKKKVEIESLVGELEELSKKVDRELTEADLSHIDDEDMLARIKLQTIYKRLRSPELPFKRASELYSPEKVQEILNNFKKAHSFIPRNAYENIMNLNWGGWGMGKNFVASIESGNKDYEAAKLAESEEPGGGIAYLEKTYGIPPGSWSKDAEGIVYRFVVQKPQLFDLRLPMGDEERADPDYWLAGGKTMGGVWEAVITAICYDQLEEALRNGVVVIKKVTFNGDSTQEHILTQMRLKSSSVRGRVKTEDSEWAGSDIATEGGGSVRRRDDEL